MKQHILFFFFLLIGTFAYNQSCVGKWITVDDETGIKKSIVELYKYEDKLYGKIIYLYPKEGREANPKCTACTGDLKDKPLIGLKIIRYLSWNGEEWTGGTVVNPKTGKIYSATLWLDAEDQDTLYVRGYSGPFFRTQTWIRSE